MTFENAPVGSRSLLLAATLFAACRSAPHSWSELRQECDYVDPRCPAGEICTQVNEHGKPSKSLCLPLAEETHPIVGPFVPGHAFWCSQGPHSPRGRSHSFGSDVFATDFASFPEEDSVSVLAPASGTAYVFDACEERDESGAAHNVSSCGAGYGNHVKIWDGRNLILVAHLSRVLIDDGPVVAGREIGLEGASGAAGHRHVHLSISQMAPGQDPVHVATTPGWKGAIPVRFRVHLARGQVLWNDRLQCADQRERARRYEQRSQRSSSRR